MVHIVNVMNARRVIQFILKKCILADLVTNVIFHYLVLAHVITVKDAKNGIVLITYIDVKFEENVTIHLVDVIITKQFNTNVLDTFDAMFGVKCYIKSCSCYFLQLNLK